MSEICPWCSAGGYKSCDRQPTYKVCVRDGETGDIVCLAYICAEHQDDFLRAGFVLEFVEE